MRLNAEFFFRRAGFPKRIVQRAKPYATVYAPFILSIATRRHLLEKSYLCPRIGTYSKDHVTYTFWSSLQPHQRYHYHFVENLRDSCDKKGLLYAYGYAKRVFFRSSLIFGELFRRIRVLVSCAPAFIIRHE